MQISKVVISYLFLFCFLNIINPSPVNADIFAGGRSDNAKVQAYFNNSVASYDYTTIYRTAQDRWRGITRNVTLERTLSTSGYPDLYNVSGLRRESANGGRLLGQAIPHNSSGNQIATRLGWRYVVITLYHNNFVDLGFTTNQRIATTVHEVGHSLKLAHPESQDGELRRPLNGRNSIMIQGRKDATYPQGYDEMELRRKWD